MAARRELQARLYECVWVAHEQTTQRCTCEGVYVSGAPMIANGIRGFYQCWGRKHQRQRSGYICTIYQWHYGGVITMCRLCYAYVNIGRSFVRLACACLYRCQNVLFAVFAYASVRELCLLYQCTMRNRPRSEKIDAALFRQIYSVYSM